MCKMYITVYIYIYIYAYNIYVVEISQPYVCNRLILIPSNRKLRHMYSCVSLILEISQTQISIHWSCSSHGGKLHSKLDPAWRNQSGMSQTRNLDPRKFSEKGSRTTYTSLINWSLQLGKIWSTLKHKYFRKTGKK